MCHSSIPDSCDPMKQELQEVIKDYRAFLTNSLCVDHFTVFECLRRLLKDDPALFRDVFSKVVTVWGARRQGRAVLLCC